MNDPFETGLSLPNGAGPLGVAEIPPFIDRYRIERVLGKGGFGLVYLAHDDQLQRFVAIKVPHPHRISATDDAEAYLTEARTVANLDHPHIVPVFDVGSTRDCPCFVVSKFIDGADLAARLKQSRLPLGEAVELVATVAEALHFAHKQGLVHRDIKPGNILLDNNGKPFVADFGLALREQDVGTGPRYTGTPAYMSPEQARGEGHRVDGRSDIFSLGVVCYEMLVGRRPFQADSYEALQEQIAEFDVRPPRQIDDSIPKELERICLRALSKRASDRFTTAKDMAEDLRHWLKSHGGDHIPAKEALAKTAEPEPAAAPGLKKHAFLSHATPDKDVAHRLCRFLEEQGIGCWIAPRDVAPGADYGEAIIRGIETTGTTVLLLSASANASVHVKHEVERATSKHKRVIPVRLEDVLPAPSLELHLATAHRLDAFRLTTEQTASQLAAVLRGEELATPASAGTAPPDTPSSGDGPIKIVPKGLRSFDAHDADFFLELLPGPRDREGLPDSIRFWKTRIEEKDADGTFPVGLIYGPSGCGKSSLVKAGLVPRLSEGVIAVYVEATAEETEARLLNGLRKRCRALSENPGLKETLAALRRGQGIPAGKKVLIVLDQFEQWLHAKKEETNTELVQALRQCDGSRVQCVVMVRDDFWMAATRFMRELEVRLVEAQNSAAVDLFPIRHAEKVLAAFGRAFGVLPDAAADAGKEQKEFLNLAVAGLAQEGKVISVRLALFAEMMKGKAWTPASLKEVGGTEGVGVTFLEETFSANTAPPQHRYHQKAARGVLKALLPESGADIKGHMRSYDELLEASGYARRPKDFDDLIRILDGEIRLITPTDPEGKDGAEEFTSQVQPGARYYQLTHDYLVPSLRDWLTRKQKETRRGRAELLLADRAVVWNARPEDRQLPSLVQWLQIRRSTAKKSWTPPQKKMMRKASRYHALRGFAVGALLAAAIFTGLTIRDRVEEQNRVNREQAEEKRKATYADGLVRAVLNADTVQTPAMVGAMAEYRKWTDALLRDEYDKSAANSRQKLHASLALLPVDPSQADYLYGRLLDAAPGEVPVIRDALVPHQDDLLDKLWAVVEKPEKGKESQRLRAAAALAKYDPQSERWGAAGVLVVNDLVLENAFFLGQWSEAFRPVKDRLLPPLSVIYRDRRPERAAERGLATNILADYAADRPDALVEMIGDADDRQFAVLLPVIEKHREKAAELLRIEVAKTPPRDEPPADASVKDWKPSWNEARHEEFASKRAGAAAALLRLGAADSVWPVLKHSPYPEARSRLIHRLAACGVDAKILLERLGLEKDASIRQALILALGEYGEPGIPMELRREWLPKLLEWYETDPDAGVHGAIDWLLRHEKDGPNPRPLAWEQRAGVAAIDLAMANQARAKLAAAVASPLARLAGSSFALEFARAPSWPALADRAPKDRRWFVNAQGQTFTLFDSQEAFLMGSPISESGHQEYETLHWQKIGRKFALQTKAVTAEDFQRFLKANPTISHSFTKQYSPDPDGPIISVTWYVAAQYCRWLSEQEGIPEEQMVYPGIGEIEKCKEGAPLALPKDHLQRTGYRLPTEAEWEYACRGGTSTIRGYGSSLDLLPRYAWHLQNSHDRAWPVGQKKPNDAGCFDLHGNTWTWCQESGWGYKTGSRENPTLDLEDKRSITDKLSRVLRGGSFDNLMSFVRSASRYFYVPADVVLNGGFRVARTFTP